MFKTITSFIATWQVTLYAVAVALLIGFSSGWYVSGKFNDAERNAGLIRIIETSKSSVNASNKVETKIVVEKAKIEVRYVKQIKEIIKYVPETVYKQCVTEDGNTIDTTLDVNAVRVLNDEPFTSVQPTSVGNAEVKTHSEVGLRELSDYVITIKKQYQDLATEHDGLVDYNNEYKTLINQ